MTMPKLPFKAIGLWLLDFAKMPSRVAELAKAKEADKDGRASCISCATGHVGNLKPMTDALTGKSMGTCDACQCRFTLSGDGKIIGVLGVHSPPSA